MNNDGDRDCKHKIANTKALFDTRSYTIHNREQAYWEQRAHEIIHEPSVGVYKLQSEYWLNHEDGEGEECRELLWLRIYVGDTCSPGSGMRQHHRIGAKTCLSSIQANMIAKGRTKTRR